MTTEELEQMKQEEPNSMSPSYEYIKGWNDALDAVIDTEPKQGEWIDGKDTCSVCGMMSEYFTQYCGGCGAYMTNGHPSCGYGEVTHDTGR